MLWKMSVVQATVSISEAITKGPLCTGLVIFFGKTDFIINIYIAAGTAYRFIKYGTQVGKSKCHVAITTPTLRICKVRKRPPYIDHN